MGQKILKEASLVLHLKSGSDVFNTIIYRGGRPKINEAVRCGEVFAKVTNINRNTKPITVELIEIRPSEIDPKQYYTGTTTRRFNII